MYSFKNFTNKIFGKCSHCPGIAKILPNLFCARKNFGDFNYLKIKDNCQFVSELSCFVGHTVSFVWAIFVMN